VEKIQEVMPVLPVSFQKLVAASRRRVWWCHDFLKGLPGRFFPVRIRKKRNKPVEVITTVALTRNRLKT